MTMLVAKGGHVVRAVRAGGEDNMTLAVNPCHGVEPGNAQQFDPRWVSRALCPLSRRRAGARRQCHQVIPGANLVVDLAPPSRSNLST